IIAITNVYLQIVLLTGDLNDANILSIGMSGLIIGLISFLASIMVAAVVYSYMKIYHQKPEMEIEVSEVWKHARNLFFPYVLAVIVTSILVFIGSLFFLIPGIYLFFAFLIIYPIMANEGKGFGDALGRCFTLISGKWWSTFGLVVLTYLIVLIISLVFSIPSLILQEIVGTSTLGNVEISGNNIVYEIALVVITVIQNFASYILYAIVFVALAFQYGNLVERKEAVGLLNKIDNLGTKPDDEEVSI
ncbi:MAG: hypothetical protein ACOCXH_08840, partial [Cyclobacteriaceae bacterium]